MDKLNLRSQVALQFVIVIGILLFIFITFFAIIANRNSEDNNEKVMIQAHDIISTVQKEIVIASSVLDGYSREFQIPSKIGTLDYSIYIPAFSNRTLILNFQGNNFTKRIPTTYGQPHTGLNTIHKDGGEVYIS